MAFGLPAKYQQVFQFEMPQEEARLIIRGILAKLEWPVTIEQDEDFLHAKTTAGYLSIGERVFIDIREDHFGILSQCFIPTQFVDFGRNKKNIQHFAKLWEEAKNKPEEFIAAADKIKKATFFGFDDEYRKKPTEPKCGGPEKKSS